MADESFGDDLWEFENLSDDSEDRTTMSGSLDESESDEDSSSNAISAEQSQLESDSSSEQEEYSSRRPTEQPADLGPSPLNGPSSVQPELLVPDGQAQCSGPVEPCLDQAYPPNARYAFKPGHPQGLPLNQQSVPAGTLALEEKLGSAQQPARLMMDRPSLELQAQAQHLQTGTGTDDPAILGDVELFSCMPAELETADAALIEADLGNVDEGSLETSDAIWKRTRAKNPLTEIPIEELEALLQDDFSEPTYDDDEAYKAFLSAFADQNSPDWEASLLPEEDDDDRDFLLDPDALLADDDGEYFLPSSYSSPLQTRFRGSKKQKLSPDIANGSPEPLQLDLDDAAASESKAAATNPIRHHAQLQAAEAPLIDQDSINGAAIVQFLDQPCALSVQKPPAHNLTELQSSVNEAEGAVAARLASLRPQEELANALHMAPLRYPRRSMPSGQKEEEQVSHLTVAPVSAAAAAAALPQPPASPPLRRIGKKRGPYKTKKKIHGVPDDQEFADLLEREISMWPEGNPQEHAGSKTTAPSSSQASAAFGADSPGLDPSQRSHGLWLGSQSGAFKKWTGGLRPTNAALRRNQRRPGTS